MILFTYVTFNFCEGTESGTSISSSFQHLGCDKNALHFIQVQCRASLHIQTFRSLTKECFSVPIYQPLRKMARSKCLCDDLMTKE